VGGGFTNTNELHVMKYHEAINGPDGKKWKAEVKTEHGRMVESGVFEKVKLIELPMILEMNNKGAVNLVNCFSVQGRTQHIDVKQCFLQEPRKQKCYL
jgi:hypothetical protein